MNNGKNKQCRILAIDGPSASGKSTVSREIAGRLGWVYVDSGAIYRGLTWELLRRGVDMNDAAAIARTLPDIRVEYFIDDRRAARFRIDQKILDNELRSAEVCENVSLVAAVPEVRTQVVKWLKDLTRFGSLVMEGRDIGTVVFPQAEYKFYLDADPAERARRRQRDETAMNKAPDLSAVQDSLSRRDRRDSSRAAAPLRIAADARRLDTTEMNLPAVVDFILQVLAPQNNNG